MKNSVIGEAVNLNLFKSSTSDYIMMRSFHYSIFCNRGMITIPYLMSTNYPDQLALNYYYHQQKTILLSLNYISNMQRAWRVHP